MKEEQQQKTPNNVVVDEQEGGSLFSFSNLFYITLINWRWFVLSVIVCLGAATLYLRYQVPIYQATAKFMIKNEGRTRSSLNSANFGTVSLNEGLSNEMELLRSQSIAVETVKHLKLYVTYYQEGHIVDRLLYKNQPITVELDPQSVETLGSPISLRITYKNGKYNVTGSYTVFHKEHGPEQRSINASLPALPARIRTAVGYLTFLRNSMTNSHMKEDQVLIASIVPPINAAAKFASRLGVSQLGSGTSILLLSLTDEEPARAQDYLTQLAVSYNDDANRDKNVVAVRTEQFINSRLEKINAELGMTEGKLESIKRQNKTIDLKATATNAYGQVTSYDQQLQEMATQLALFNSITEYMNMPANKYQTLPSNVGLTDAAASSLINRYNEIVLERNKLLRTANENSPSVIPLTEQLNDLTASIRRAMQQARNTYDIQKSAMEAQYNRFSAQVQQSPSQERILNEIGRQQEVRSGLYLMLLQKREENSISLAATADKGKLIDPPAYAGKVAPDEKAIMSGALGVGVAVPFAILLLLQILRYKIEGRQDVMRITGLPIAADIPIASENAKTKADIVVRENENNMMEEVFRGLRTNMTFMMKENEKIILFTSSMSGEGKTFTAANLAMSFALLSKKVLLVGLDIRRPRLAELFGIKGTGKGITTLLTIDNPTKDMVLDEIVSSGVHDNLDLMLAGPVPPNPAEIVTRDSLDKVFDVLREVYDYVIVDTAPVGLVTDTLSIARVADCTLYVCRADFTPKTSLEQVNGYAEEQKLPNISIVINGIDLSARKYGYYYGYGKYGKYGKYGSYGRYGAYGTYGRYGNVGRYGSYGTSYGLYGSYTNSHYGKKHDNSIKK